MREILFKGKQDVTGEWVEGFIYTRKENTHPVIIDMECRSHIVIPETVGQYTGLADKNGRKIFEGDIMSGKFKNYVFWYDECERGFVYGSAYKRGYLISCQTYTMSIKESEIDIIGNIYDNPELLEEREIKMFSDEYRKCFICGRSETSYTRLENHHIFGGGNRSKSDKLGLTVALCHNCHNEPPYGVHFNKQMADYLHRYGQEKCMSEQNWTEERFIKEFGKSYL